MAYEKPELVTLTSASPAIRNTGSDGDSAGKVAVVFETGSSPADGSGHGDGNPVNRQDTSETSSSSGAYQADE